MYIHISKKGINISLHIGKSQCFKEADDFMLGHTHCRPGRMWPASHGLDSPDLGHGLPGKETIIKHG